MNELFILCVLYLVLYLPGRLVPCGVSGTTLSYVYIIFKYSHGDFHFLQFWNPTPPPKKKQQQKNFFWARPCLELEKKTVSGYSLMNQ